MISVIIPYVKDRGYLSEAIDSVQGQTYKDWELILQRGDFTQGTNVNKGLDRAKGKYIKVLHDDDILPSTSLEDLHNGINGYDWACGNMRTFGEAKYCDSKIYQGCQPDFQEMLKENQVYGGTTLYNREMLLAVGGYNAYLHTGEEYDLHLRLLRGGYRCKYVPKIVHNYRFHEKNKSYYMGPGEKKERREYIREIASWYQ
jgi:glycosyltransferase involved in cell wall biosynthesis